MPNIIKIGLTEIDGQAVHLTSMSIAALESFLQSVEALKQLVSHSVGQDHVRFNILEGSAACEADFTTDTQFDIFRSDIAQAISGESEDEVIIRSLNTLGKEIKSDQTTYYCNILQGEAILINLAEELRSRPRLTRSRDNYSLKPRIVSGTLQNVGGASPNYHIAYSTSDHVTIDCKSQDEALTVNPYLYQYVSVLTIERTWTRAGRNHDYFHVGLLDENIRPIIHQFITRYNNESDLVTKLGFMYDLVDEAFTADLGHRVVKYLLKLFKNKTYHQSEIKTVLVISKGMKEHPELSTDREELLALYESKRR